MSDLISRKALIESYCEENCGERRCRDAWDRCMFVSHVLEQQPVEAVPVVHGEWIKSQSMHRSAKCSECKCWITRHSVNELWFRYCPHCGARMKV